MDDASAVSEGERVAHLADDLEELEGGLPVACLRAPPASTRRESLTFDELHREVEAAFAVGSDLMDRRDRGVVELRGDLGLAQEPAHRLDAIAQVRMQHFERHPALERTIDHQLDRAHAASRDLAAEAQPLGLGHQHALQQSLDRRGVLARPSGLVLQCRCRRGEGNGGRLTVRVVARCIRRGADFRSCGAIAFALHSSSRRAASSTHRPEVAVEPVERLLDPQQRRLRHVAAVVEQELLVRLRRAEQTEERLDGGLERNRGVVPAVDHEDWDPDPRREVDRVAVRRQRDRRQIRRPPGPAP